MVERPQFTGSARDSEAAPSWPARREIILPLTAESFGDVSWRCEQLLMMIEGARQRAADPSPQTPATARNLLERGSDEARAVGRAINSVSHELDLLGDVASFVKAGPVRETNGHHAALQVLDDFFRAVWRAADPANAPIFGASPYPFDFKMVETKWPDVAQAILAFPKFEPDDLLARIRRERARMHEQLKAIAPALGGSPVFDVAPAPPQQNQASAPAGPESPKQDQPPIAPPGAAPAPVWSIESGRYFFRGEPFELAGKPLELLAEFLRRAKDAYLDTKELQKSVWADTSTGHEGIRSTVGALRKSLKRVCEEFRLEIDDPLPNTRGAGWRFALPRE